jgi:ADP-heptose:LPS heptosyltransferase
VTNNKVERNEAPHREGGVKINLGCGSDYMQGWLNVDQWPEANPDLVMNLEQLPWKLADDCADEILLKHVLEHVGQSSNTFLGIMQELYRISRPGALIRIHVPHPRHNDFIGDPTHVRPILPEMFHCFDLAAVETWQEAHLPGTPLAKYLKVDFEVANVQHHLTQYWLKEHHEGRVDAAGIMRAIENYNNVVEWTDITLRVRKPFRPGHALRRIDAICLERHGGMGDVLMALAAAKALKTYSGRPIVLVTVPALRGLAEACPHIDWVTDDLEAVKKKYASLKYVNLNPVAYGISRLHQIDACLQAFGVSAEADHKSIDLNLDAAAEKQAADLIAPWPAKQKGRARILLHVGQGDSNRAWPLERWKVLATELIALGHQVVAIGSDAGPQNGGKPLVAGVLSAINQLSTLGTVALMRQSDLLVSTDGGPVQLAGASDIGIVGLYSVVAGSRRLPFRHGTASWNAAEVKPSCRFYPCYQYLHDAQIMAPYSARLQNGTLTAAEMFASWCPDGGSFACMKQQISVADVMEAIGRLDPEYLREKKPAKAGAAASKGRVASKAAARGASAKGAKTGRAAAKKGKPKK